MAKFESVTEKSFAAATTRGKRFGALRAEKARFDRRSGKIFISMSTGLDVSFSPKAAQGLEDATPDQLAGVEVTGGGSVTLTRARSPGASGGTAAVTLISPGNIVARSEVAGSGALPAFSMTASKP